MCQNLRLSIWVIDTRKQKIEMSKNSINDELSYDFVSLTANLERLSSSEVIVIQGILKDMELDIVKKMQDNPDMSSWRKSRYNALLAQVKDQIASTYGKITDREQQVLAQIAEATGKATTKIFGDIGIPLQSVVVTPEQWKALSTKSLIQGAPSAAWWAKQDKNLQDAFVREMRIGYASGETIDQLVARVRGTPTGKRHKYIINGKERVYVEYRGGIMDTDTRHAKALVRTSIMQVAADAKMEMFKKNADILKGIMWQSTLDLRTTQLCASRSGKMWTLDGEPIGHDLSFLGGVPAHFNCRSTLVPVTKSFEELGATPGVTAEYLDSIGESTQASMNGQVPDSLTFDSWFNTLPEADQKAFLGQKKYEIWKKAGLNFQDMVDQQGNPLTIGQLAHDYGFKIKESVESGIPNIPKEMVSAIAVEQQAQRLASERLKEMNEAAIQDAKKQWDAIRIEVDNALGKDENDIDAHIRDMALERSQNADDALRMAMYDSQLELIKTENARIESELQAMRNKDSTYAELEKQWLDKMREYGREIPYWDMHQYQRELDAYIQSQNASAFEKMLVQPKQAYERAIHNRAVELALDKTYKRDETKGIKTLEVFEQEKIRLAVSDDKAKKKLDALLQEADYKAAYRVLRTEGKLPILKSDILPALDNKLKMLNEDAEKELLDISRMHPDSLEYKAYLKAESKYGKSDGAYVLLLEYRRILQRMTKQAAKKFNRKNEK